MNRNCTERWRSKDPRAAEVVQKLTSVAISDTERVVVSGNRPLQEFPAG